MGDLTQKTYLTQLFEGKYYLICVRPNLWSKTFQLTSGYESNLHSVRLSRYSFLQFKRIDYCLCGYSAMLGIFDSFSAVR